MLREGWFEILVGIVVIILGVLNIIFFFLGLIKPHIFKKAVPIIPLFLSKPESWKTSADAAIEIEMKAPEPAESKPLPPPPVQRSSLPPAPRPNSQMHHPDEIPQVPVVGVNNGNEI